MDRATDTDLLLIFKGDSVIIIVKENKRIIGQTSLTISQGFDILLIRAIDNLMHRYKINKLSLKRAKVSGKPSFSELSMIIAQMVVASVGI